MKAEKLYPIISKLEEQWKKDCGGMLSPGVATEFALLKENLEKEMRDVAAKQGGVKSVYNAANAIIKNYPLHIRICSDKKPKQFNWFLSWVEFALVALEELYRLRVTQATFIVSCDTL